MTPDQITMPPTDQEVAHAMTCCGTIGSDMIRRLAFQRDEMIEIIGQQAKQLSNVVSNLKHIGSFAHNCGDDPHPLDCSLGGRVSQVFGTGMTRARRICIAHGQDPDWKEEKNVGVDTQRK